MNWTNVLYETQQDD